MIPALIIVYLTFGLGFATGYCGAREAEGEGNRFYLTTLWLASIVSWPMGAGLFVGSWMAKYWICNTVGQTSVYSLEDEQEDGQTKVRPTNGRQTKVRPINGFTNKKEAV